MSYFSNDDPIHIINNQERILTRVKNKQDDLLSALSLLVPLRKEIYLCSATKGGVNH
jgi:hypothetical protein